MIERQVVFDSSPHSGLEAVHAGKKRKETTLTRVQPPSAVCASHGRTGNPHSEKRNCTRWCHAGSGAVSCRGDHKAATSRPSPQCHALQQSGELGASTQARLGT